MSGRLWEPRDLDPTALAGLPPQGRKTLTSVVLHVIHCHVGGHEGCLAVLLLVLLLCQQAGLGILRGNDIFDFSAMGRKEPHPIRWSQPLGLRWNSLEGLAALHCLRMSPALGHSTLQFTNSPCSHILMELSRHRRCSSSLLIERKLGQRGHVICLRLNTGKATSEARSQKFPNFLPPPKMVLTTAFPPRNPLLEQMFYTKNERGITGG